MRERKPVVHEAIDGVIHVLSDASLRGLAISYALYMVSMGILTVAVPAIVVRQVGAEGMTLGGQAGFNWQVDNFVAGLETDFQSFHQRASSTATAIYPTGGAAGFPFTISQSFSTDWLWTLRPRLGFAR